MRRLVASLGVVGIAAALVIVPGSAATAAAPVSAFPYLPSSFVAQTSIAPPVMPEGTSEAEWNEWRRADRAYRQTVIDEVKGRNYAPNTAPQPASPPKAPTRGIAGGPLGTLLLAPVIVNGALQMIAISAEGEALGVGDSPEEILCSMPPGYADSIFYGLIYGEVDCGYIPVDPNSDVVVGWGLTYAGVGYASQVFSATNSFSGGINGICVLGAALPAGYSMRALDSVGAWNATNGFASPAYNGGPNTTPQYACGSSAAGYAAVYTSNNPKYYTGAFRVVNSSSVVVATATQATADPERKARCEVGWSDSSVTTGYGTSTFTETEGISLPQMSTACTEAYTQRPSPGVLPEWVKPQTELDGGGAITEIADMPVPSEVEEPKPSEGLKLQRIIGTQVLSCMTWETDCANWWEQSDEGTNTSEYRCTWGGSTVDLAECGIYRNTFKDPDNVKIMDPREDHEYGWSTGTDPFVTPGTGPATVTGGGACSPTWSWNPVDWVLNPLKCAFIPSTASVTAAQTNMGNAWNNSRAGQLHAAILTVQPALAAIDAGDCGGLIVPVPVPGSSGNLTIENHALLAACPGDFFAPWAPVFFWFNTGTLLIGGFFAVRLMLNRMVGNT